jgi:hypothetical protein
MGQYIGFIHPYYILNMESFSPHGQAQHRARQIGPCARKHRALAVLILVCGLGSSCTGKAETVLIEPPPTSPLSMPVIGYGVVNVSYTHVANEPKGDSVSKGYLRKGSIVQVLEHRQVPMGETAESWVWVEGTYRGWLREEVVDIYSREVQAQTAARVMIQ